MDDKVKAVFDSQSEDIRAGLEMLRRLILDTADKTPGVGSITEDLRWGQPSYLTHETGSGTTVRIDAVRSKPDSYAIYFHCQTGLVDDFRELYGDLFTYEGNRAIVFRVGDKVPAEELAHCISLALTHHARKKKNR